MINIIDKSKCCGCASCVQRCPKQCISLVADDEGFFYPLIDAAKCVDCGLCERVCPELNLQTPTQPQHVYAAINVDTHIRLQSSSGGIFTPLASQIIASGGVIFGARFDSDWQVEISYTETIEGLQAFRGSKYVYARVGKSFSQCEQFLKQGRIVLFSATPCIISGLLHYLNKKYANLLTVDLACHGVPSSLIWQKYLEETTAQRAVDGKSTVLSSLNAKSSIKDIKFREKSKGWKKYRFVLSFNEPSGDVEKSSVLSSIHSENPFFQAFNTGVILRPSCYTCTIKNSCRSGADITLADFWGIENVDPSLDDDKGTSLILVNTERGKDLIDSLNLLTKEFPYDIALKYNNGLRVGSYKHPNRKFFFANYKKGKNVLPLLEKSIKPSFAMRIDRYIKAVRRRLVKMFRLS
ncbi:Coenzyme F420 hydrogenase/dehydrogenase, beta subunit C-terminal domain [Segatella copri]|uniref:Coenzyme F420 hydrogenase/dehydrogenase, beta subunit C-terminal domain n=1 Tax=Segatella copri TaxID=165179 RepID=UPI003F8C6707